jgi:hypothetical protein
LPRIAFIAALIALSAFSIAQEVEGPILYDRPRQLGRMSNPDITESSGLAMSIENENVFWTHNDRGDQPRVFAFNSDGTHLAEYRIEGKNVDWEDMCTFKTDRDSYILIGDVGDKDAKRKKSRLYVLREPKLTKNPKFGKVETLTPQMDIEFTFEDGSHNCEAVGVDASAGKTAKVLFVTKSDSGTCKVFEMPLPLRKEKGATYVAKAIASLTLPAVTAMDISPDGRRAVVLTYGDAYEFTRGATETWAQAFARKARVLEMPIRKQGETICYGKDGKTLYLTSEGSPAPLWMIAPKKTE